MVADRFELDREDGEQPSRPALDHPAAGRRTGERKDERRRRQSFDEVCNGPGQPIATDEGRRRFHQSGVPNAFR